MPENRLGRLSLPKILKIALGCCLAYGAARLMNLQYATSAVTITLLSIQDTRRSTFRLAGTRCLAFLLALGLSWGCFSLLGFHLGSLGVFLLLFVTGCQWFSLEGGLSMSTVLVLHLWSAQTLSLPAMANELALMGIGIAMGILMNLYMPREAHKIRADQQQIDEGFRAFLLGLADRMQAGSEAANSELETLRDQLDNALLRARSYMENSFTADTRYFVQYVQLRRRQWDVLRALEDCLPRLRASSYQARVVAAFIRLTARSLHEYNNAQALLDELAAMRRHFRETALPATRAEFEERAVLYEMVNLLRRLLLYKQEFARQLTPSQIRRFWKEG